MAGGVHVSDFNLGVGTTFAAGTLQVDNGLNNQGDADAVRLGDDLGGRLDNAGSLALAGGTLAGTGALVNTGLLSGWGTIAGTGGYSNDGQLAVSGLAAWC